MKPLAQLSRQLPAPATLQELADELGKKYTVQDAPAQTTTLHFYDSFDWRLYSNALLCFEQNNGLHLTDPVGRDLVPSLPISGEAPGFYWQLPDSALKQKLAPVLEMRTLLLQSSFSQTTRQLRILNKDEKTVATLILSELRVETGESDQPICSVQLHQVRGYEKWFQRLEQDLEAFGSPQPCTKEQDLKTALAAKGRSPQDYSSKFSVTLKSDMAALTAAKSIYRDLLGTMQKNEQGILDDLDSEFLHDFRVAIRRTRSGLDMIKKALEPKISARFKEEFRYLGKITGPVRDLDVYLLMEEDYKAMLPDHLQKGLHYFFEDLAEQRKKEQEKLVQALQSSQYKTIIKDWEKYLRQKKNTEATEKTPVIGIMAKKIIRKRFERVLRDGRAIDTDSPDESLHRLRIQGKKLRYCLEFFSSLYPPKEMKRLIKQLKNLQNNLGLFNDLSVQQDMLNNYLASLKPGSGKAKKMGAAIGGLLTNLYHEQQQVRTEFEAAFRCFSSQENISLYENLFATEQKPNR
ncbi:CHAD domain-containing protein [Candidatus Electrothrix aarhusensis]|uniref:CHAD domain-containing protein n=1 Tax=Candidatus Electrothrix aarhusensis TaxID=1859131 RepID=A0A444IV02_9BACT|nr:CHAD domain-containing protein [Candidatus Electrothrix aarhusensis]